MNHLKCASLALVMAFLGLGPTLPTTQASAAPLALVHIEELAKTRIIVLNSNQESSLQMGFAHGFLFQAKGGCVMYQRTVGPDETNTSHSLNFYKNAPSFVIFPKGSRVLRAGTTVSTGGKLIKLGDNTVLPLGIARSVTLTPNASNYSFSKLPASCRPASGQIVIEIEGALGTTPKRLP